MDKALSTHPILRKASTKNEGFVELNGYIRSSDAKGTTEIWTTLSGKVRFFVATKAIIEAKEDEEKRTRITMNGSTPLEVIRYDRQEIKAADLDKWQIQGHVAPGAQASLAPAWSYLMGIIDGREIWYHIGFNGKSWTTTNPI